METISVSIISSTILNISEQGQQGSLLDVADVSSVEGNSSAMTDNFAELPTSFVTSLGSLYNQKSAPIKQPSQLNNTNTSRVPASVPVNSVSVPRPTPLVQSNVGMDLNTATSGVPNSRTVYNPAQQLQQQFQSGQPISIVPQDKPQTFQRSCDPTNTINQSQVSDKSHESGQDRGFMASQIAELNRQHAEAHKRLQTLMNQQQQDPSQQQQQQPPQQQQQQQQQQRQQVVENQQRIQQQQQLQHEQQQKLIEMVMQQQQKIQRQHQLQQQQQQQQQHLLQQRQTQPESVQPPVNWAMEAVRQSVDIPGYVPTQRQVSYKLQQRKLYNVFSIGFMEAGLPGYL